MEIVDHTLVFHYNGEKMNVPLLTPWELYTGDLVPAREYVEQVDRKVDQVINYVTFHITEKCNMACTYCFEKDKSSKTSNLGVTRGLIDLIEKHQPEVFNIRFIGGEPLTELDFLEDSIRLIEGEVKKRGISTKIQYNLFTNATIINQRALDLIRTYKIVVICSMDCCQSIHDKYRVYRNGQGTFQTVVENILRLKQALPEQRILCRAVYTDDISLIEIVDELERLDFDEISVGIPFLPDDSELALTREKTEQMKARILEFTQESIRRIERKDFSWMRIVPITRMISFLGRQKNILSNRACLAGCSQFAISPDGELYPCHMFVGYDQFKLGNLNEGVTNLDLQTAFLNYSTENAPACQSCPIQYLCIGNCMGEALLYRGNINQPNPYKCEIQKEYVKSAFYLYSHIKQNPLAARYIRYYSKQSQKLFGYV
ncbi:radical SAM/SPASM domain-containing protein [Gorillibacterium timonense]|uniref:radical SAM/SPASM domain-containing protein n=1 Tax=Gorillibacterium timonense TaxID=1689269 RepID=UPI00071DC0A9|nr:radical SAM protein [Gorillibacterium timonense]